MIVYMIMTGGYLCDSDGIFCDRIVHIIVIWDCLYDADGLLIRL